MNKIKVLTVVTRLNVGGVSSYCATVIKNLPKDQYDNLIIYGTLCESEGDMSELFEGVNQQFIPEMGREISPKKDFKAFMKIIKIIRQYRPDVIHTHTAKAGILGRLAGWLTGTKVIIHTFHGNVFQGYFGKAKTLFFINVERFLALISTKIIAISKQQKAELVSFKIAKENKIEVINLGFDFSNVIPEADFTTDFKDRFNIPDKNKVIGIVGRIVPIKNHKMFVDIAENVVKSNIENVTFLVVGDGEDRTEIEQYIESKQLTKHFAFTGFTNKLKEVYHVIDYLLLTSLNEGTPVAIIEAMVNRKLILSTNVGGVTDFVDNNESGFIFEKQDVRGFSEKLIDLLNRQSPKEIDDMKEKAYRTAINKFGCSTLTKNINKIYREQLHKELK